MKPSEKKKIYTEMMTASDQTKFRICHQLLTGKYIALDGKDQFNDYSVLEECSMWRSWYLSYGKQSNQVLEN